MAVAMEGWLGACPERSRRVGIFVSGCLAQTRHCEPREAFLEHLVPFGYAPNNLFLPTELHTQLGIRFSCII